MSLNYDFSKVENYKKKIRSKRGEVVLNALIWATMSIGIRKITETNSKKFFARLRALESVKGAFIYKNGKPSYITQKEVENFIGLFTNVDEMTGSQFEKKYFTK